MKWNLQGVSETQGGRESHSSGWTEEQWEWILVSCATEDCALWPGLPPQWPDQWWEEVGGRGLFLRSALPPHLHLNSRRWHQPSRTQVCLDLYIWKHKWSNQICLSIERGFLIMCTSQGDSAVPICSCRVFKEKSVQTDGGQSRTSRYRCHGWEYPDPAGQRYKHGKEHRFLHIISYIISHIISYNATVYSPGQKTTVCTNGEMLQ